MKMANDQFDITVREQQFLTILRHWKTMPQEFQVMIKHAQGAWDVEVKQLGTERLVHGTGATFDEAWDNIKQVPSWWSSATA
jgi:hypothetical protein